MPSAPEKFDEIDRRLDSLEQKLGTLVSPPRWYAKAYTWVINHKGTSLVLSIILCVAGGYFKYWLDHRNDGFNDAVDRRIQNALSAPRGVSETLEEVKKTTDETNTTLKTLQPYIQDAIRHDFDNVAKLSGQTLGERLPAVSNLISAAQSEKVKVDPQTIAATGQRLLSASKDTPAVWRVVGELISYHSQLVAGWEQSSLPLCTNPTINATFTQGSKEVTHGPVKFYSCKIVLDSPQATTVLSPSLSFADVVFDHCAIFYSGGPIVLIPVKMARDTPPKLIGKINFQDCSFVFSLTGTPPASGQRLTKNLLAATSNSIQFDANENGSS